MCHFSTLIEKMSKKDKFQGLNGSKNSIFQAQGLNGSKNGKFQGLNGSKNGKFQGFNGYRVWGLSLAPPYKFWCSAPPGL